MADFLAALDTWIHKAEGRADQVVRGIAEQALATVKEYTPVDTGNLRAAWSIVPGGQELAIVPHDQRTVDQPGSGTPLSIDLTGIKAGDIIRIVNPTAYARPVEFGYSIKLKAGGERHVEGRYMATRTVAELPRIAERVIRDIAGGGA